MNLQPIKVDGKLNVRATAEAQAKAQKDLTIEDPTDEDAKMVIEKAVAEGLDDEKSEQKTPQSCRTSDSTDSEPEKE
ncbi:MAG TPA: hypothetical protein ENH82_05435 [bacterium]|nr:hypothetical protein [bacterium]